MKVFQLHEQTPNYFVNPTLTTKKHSSIMWQWCNKECEDEDGYKNHLETHVKCMLAFDTHIKFKRHMKTHWTKLHVF